MNRLLDWSQRDPSQQYPPPREYGSFKHVPDVSPCLRGYLCRR